MIEIEKREKIEEEIYQMVDKEFNQYAKNNGLACNYTPFVFVAKDQDKVIGVIKGHSYYQEVQIGDLIVLKEYRHKHIGSKLVKAVEDYYQGKGFSQINLTTYGFEAPEFYKKCGYQVEFIREDKENPKLNKYFLIKYF